MLDSFWAVIDKQLAALRSATTADNVIDILNATSSPSSGDAFFGGSGGDDGVNDALTDAGWSYVWSEADYHWAMRSPVDGSVVTYVEGDIFRGDQR